MKKIITVLMCVLMSLSMMACGKSDVVGKHVLIEIASGDTTVKEGEDKWNEVFAEKKPEEIAYLEFTDDGKFTFRMISDKITEGTWEQDGNTIKLTSGGETEEATIEDDKIILKEETATATFKKN